MQGGHSNGNERKCLGEGGREALLFFLWSSKLPITSFLSPVTYVCLDESH